MQKKRAVLLTNLGTPTDLTSKDIKHFLTVFLMDKNVIDYPYLLRYFLVKNIIVPIRTPKALQAYRKIWTKEGSPLLTHSANLKNELQSITTLPVALSMRYGEPSTQSAFEELLKKEPDLDEVVVIPLYPQFTMSSYGTAVEAISSVHRREKYSFELRFAGSFYNSTDYIATLAETIKPHLANGYDKLLFSYHGIPKRHLRKDERKRGGFKNKIPHFPETNYQEQALETSALVANFLQIPDEKYEVSFQSRLTFAGIHWIEPYTSDRLKELPGEGVKKLLVVCPAFVADCLETLEEIGMEGKQLFLQSGGQDLKLIPCINSNKQFAANIVEWIKKIEDSGAALTQ